MAHPRSKADRSFIQFWLPDPNDIEKVLQLLEICGYTDKCMAHEDAAQSGESSTLYEVTITPRDISTVHAWRDEVSGIEHLHDGVWQA